MNSWRKIDETEFHYRFLTYLPSFFFLISTRTFSLYIIEILKLKNFLPSAIRFLAADESFIFRLNYVKSVRFFLPLNIRIHTVSPIFASARKKKFGNHRSFSLKLDSFGCIRHRSLFFDRLRLTSCISGSYTLIVYFRLLTIIRHRLLQM